MYVKVKCAVQRWNQTQKLPSCVFIYFLILYGFMFFFVLFKKKNYVL